MKPKIRLVRGMGINDSDKPAAKCKFYSRWANMLLRASNSRRFLRGHPSYAGVEICEEWLLFSNFKKWMERQDWRGKHLDKDLAYPGNRMYSPENCLFVSSTVNAFISERGAARGPYKIGVSWHPTKRKFVAKCSNPFTGNGDQIGEYLTEDEAHEAWKSRKLQHAIDLAAQQDDPRVARALVARYTNYVIQPARKK